MTPSLFLVQLLSGLAHAVVLFLIASGLSLIFGVTRIVNFAHGSLYMLGAYLTYTLAACLPLGPVSFYGGVLLASGIVGIVGIVVEVVLLRRVYRAPDLYQLLLTFALVLVVADTVRLFWGTENIVGPSAPGLSGSVALFGQLFPTYDLALLAVGPLVAILLWALLHRTRWGVLVRAATQDREMAAVLGVNQSFLFTSVFALGAFLAGLGGALQVPRQALTNVMDTGILVEAFVVVVVGGMGSIPGAFLAAVLLGVIDAFGVVFLPNASLVLIFVVMAVVLIVRPHGLLGRPETAPRTTGGVVAAERSITVPWPAWVALLLVLTALPPLLPAFYLWVLVEILAFALFAASLHLLVGTGGMLSFGHAAAFGLGAYGAALLFRKALVPMPIAFLAAPAVAAAGALIIGFFCVRLSGIYFAMLTLAFAQIAYAAVHQWYAFTGGDNGLLGIWPPNWLGTPLRFYYLSLTAGAAGIGLLSLVVRSPFGLLLRAARDQARRAQAVGINVRRQQWVAFIVAGFFGGLAGAIFVFLKGSVFPSILDVQMDLAPLVMTLLGGVHSLAGAPLGAAVYKLLDTVVGRYTQYWQLVLGSFLILLVVAFPRGILGLVRGGSDE